MDNVVWVTIAVVTGLVAWSQVAVMVALVVGAAVRHGDREHHPDAHDGTSSVAAP